MLKSAANGVNATPETKSRRSNQVRNPASMPVTCRQSQIEKARKPFTPNYKPYAWKLRIGFQKK